METVFNITLSLQLKRARFAYGKFSLGTDRQTALEIFGKLRGKIDPKGACAIHMELCQEISGLSVPIGVLQCCLEELKDNVAIISREILRISQLEDGNILFL
jgi:hypothetical protein